MRFQHKSIIFLGLIFLIVFLLFPISHLSAQNETKGRIAYVDIWRVFNVHPQKEIAENKLNEIAQSMQGELENNAKDLAKDKQQEMLSEYQSKLTLQEQQLIKEILSSIEDVITKVAEEKEVKIVLDKKNVIYGGYDMTDDVIDYIKAHEVQVDEDSEATAE